MGTPENRNGINLFLSCMQTIIDNHTFVQIVVVENVKAFRVHNESEVSFLPCISIVPLIFIWIRTH